MSKFSIIFQNDEILLVLKPAGTAVQGGQGVAHPLDDELSKQLGYRIHLVHRLDKETEGILIVAKTPQAASKWTKLIAGDSVKKEYYALCLGVPVVNGKKSMKGVLKGSVEAHGRVQVAETFFDVVASREVMIPLAEGDVDSVLSKVTLSLVHIVLGTGRMHQIRIQMAKAMCPLCGDDQHGDFKLNKKIRKLGIRKLCLASTKITIPVDGSLKVFEIPMPSHMQKPVDEYLS